MDGRGVWNLRDPVSANNAIREGNLVVWTSLEPLRAWEKKRKKVENWNVLSCTDAFKLGYHLTYALPVAAVASVPDDNTIWAWSLPVQEVDLPTSPRL